MYPSTMSSLHLLSIHVSRCGSSGSRFSGVHVNPRSSLTASEKQSNKESEARGAVVSQALGRKTQAVFAFLWLSSTFANNPHLLENDQPVRGNSARNLTTGLWEPAGQSLAGTRPSRKSQSRHCVRCNADIVTETHNKDST